MPNAVIPELSGRRHTVDTALKSPTAIRNRIAQLAGSAALLPKSFHALGDKVEGGGMLYQGGRNRSNASVGAGQRLRRQVPRGVEEVLRAMMALTYGLSKSGPYRLPASALIFDTSAGMVALVKPMALWV